jgi:hypothetical protein
LQKEDMLTIKDSDSSWKFGKVLNVYDGQIKYNALVVSLKEFHTNALLLQRTNLSLVQTEQLKFEMPLTFFIRTKWGQH